MNLDNLNFYTDGAYSSSKKVGAWAVYCPEIDLHLADAERNTTNNRMEMIAVLYALEWILRSKLKSIKTVTIHSDSLYVINTMCGLYEKKTNLDIWERLDFLSFYIKDLGIEITWQHVKGHAGHVHNEVVDKLANFISQKLI